MSANESVKPPSAYRQRIQKLFDEYVEKRTELTEYTLKQEEDQHKKLLALGPQATRHKYRKLAKDEENAYESHSKEVRYRRSYEKKKRQEAEQEFKGVPEGPPVNVKLAYRRQDKQGGDRYRDIEL